MNEYETQYMRSTQTIIKDEPTISAFNFDRYIEEPIKNPRIEEAIDKFTKKRETEEQSVSVVEDNSTELFREYNPRQNSRKTLAILRLKLIISNFVILALGLFSLFVYNFVAIGTLNAEIKHKPASTNNIQVLETNNYVNLNIPINY